MKGIKGLAAVILAGGRGTRFQDVCGKIPKSMAPVGLKNKPHLEYLVDYLLKKGIQKVIIVTGFLSEIIEDNFFSWRRKGVEIILDPPEIPDTGGATKNAILHLLKDKNYFIKDILYWSPDTLVSGVDPERLYQYHLSHGLPSTIVFTNDPTAPNTGKIKVTRKKNFYLISYFNETGERVVWENPLAHAGTGILSLSTLLDVLYSPPFEGRNSFCMYKEVMPYIVQRGAAAWITGGNFLEWGTAERFEKIMARHPEWIEAAYAL